MATLHVCCDRNDFAPQSFQVEDAAMMDLAAAELAAQSGYITDGLFFAFFSADPDNPEAIEGNDPAVKHDGSAVTLAFTPI